MHLDNTNCPPYSRAPYVVCITKLMLKILLQGQVMPMASFLLRCLETAEVNSLTSLHERCVELFADPDVPLQVNDILTNKNTKSGTRVSLLFVLIHMSMNTCGSESGLR